MSEANVNPNIPLPCKGRSVGIEAVHIVVRGRVQGVWFRGSAQALAAELELSGWAKNCPDGTVEIHVEGARASLDKFIEWCKKGPPSADVNGLDVTPVPPREMEKFFIR